jgi:hypothetical protein
METEAQQLTELRVQELDQAQQRTALRVDELAGAVHRLAEEYRLFRYSSDLKLGGLGAQWGIQTEEAFLQGLRRSPLQAPQKLGLSAFDNPLMLASC